MGDKRQAGSRAVIVVDIHKVGTVSDGLPVVLVIMPGNFLLLRHDLQHLADAISIGINNSRADRLFHSISLYLSVMSFTTGAPRKMQSTPRSCATSSPTKNHSVALGIGGRARTRRAWTGFLAWRLLRSRGIAYRNQLNSRTRPCRLTGHLENATQTLPPLPLPDIMRHR